METIILHPVKSSQIKAVGYGAFSKTLAVEFKSGSVYHYANVEPDIHAAFVNAESLGKYFGANIKPFTDKYPFTRLPPKAL